MYSNTFIVYVMLFVCVNITQLLLCLLHWMSYYTVKFDNSIFHFVCNGHQKSDIRVVDGNLDNLKT